MKKIFKPSQFKTKKTIIIISMVLACLIIPLTTNALSLGQSIARNFFITLARIVMAIVGIFVSFGATFLQSVLSSGFQGTYKVIAETGWHVSRDFANMLFILIMVLIAFGTILRIEQYGVKKLLPKLIIIALLINFSLPISYLFVDLSNLTAETFVNKINENGSIRTKLIDSVKGGMLLTPSDCGTYKDNPEELARCNKRNEDLVEAQEDQTIIDIIVGSLVACIFLGLAAFSLFVGGIMLIVRLLFISILVILAPLAFICYIIPSLGRYSKEWWSSLFKWCFFAPIFMFFFWLAITTVNSITDFVSKYQPAQPAVEGGVLTQFFANIANSISYFLFIGLMMGGIIAAQKLGITGANAAMSMAQKAKKGATNWSKRNFVTKPALKTGGIAAGIGAKLFGGKDTKIGRRLEAKSAQLKQAVTQTKDNKAYANLLKTMPDAELLKEVETAGGSRKLIATQEAKRRGLLRESERPVVLEAMQAMRSYGDEEGARSLEELRPDAIENDVKRKEAIERAIKEGTHKKWSKKVLQSPEGVKVLGELKKQLGTGEFTKVFKGWAKEIQETAEETIRSEFTNDFTNRDNLDKRKDYAKITGKVQQAFLGDSTGIIQPSYYPRSRGAIQNHIQGFVDDDFSNLKTNKDKILAAMHMKPSQVYGAGAKLSGKDKELMKAVAQRSNPLAYAEMMKPKSS